MKPAEGDYVRYRAATTIETLQEAKILFEHGRLRGTVNRLYYACFYAVSALLFTEEHYSSKHTGIRSLFFQHWIHPGRLPVSMGRFYQQIFDNRQKGDYRDRAVFDGDEVRIWNQEAETFITRAVAEIEKRLTITT